MTGKEWNAQPRFVVGLSTIWAAVLLVLPFTKITIDFAGFFPQIAVSLLLLASGWFLGRRGQPGVRDFLNILAGLPLVAIALLSVNYIAMSFNMPLADEQLMRWDAALGFDWAAFIHFIDARRWLSGPLMWAYESFLYQLCAVPLILFALGYRRRAQAFVIGFGVLTTASAFIAILFPAYGAYRTYGVPVGSLDNLNNHFGYFFIEQFEAVRTSESFMVTTDTLSGILTFPSVHAGVAYLVIWAIWPLKWLRIPGTALNVVMAISAIANAGHYLVDILASIPLTVACALLAREIFRTGEEVYLSAGMKNFTRPAASPASASG
mgnify:CR=1 FL=1